MPSDILAPLNERQREAVESIQGPLLIIAGPGSGKTRVITHRIAYLVQVCGVTPYHIAAVTFTELAASELLIRVRDFVADLVVGTVPTELRIAFPDGLSEIHKANLAAASAAIDEITCSTIHGQRCATRQSNLWSPAATIACRISPPPSVQPPPKQSQHKRG